MVANDDVILSDEEIDVEMFDSDTELSKSAATTSRKSRVSYADDTDSDFQSSTSKRAPVPSKRGRGRGRGRGAATASTRKSVDEN
ncbi:hypothetical protein GGI13_006745, partial [Coemansia sp. RSA 455]